MPCVLSPDAVYIWCQETETLDQLAVEKAEAGLTVEERARCDRFRFSHDRRDYAVAHDLLRRSLNGLECDGRAHFSSISHARGIVACAIATGMPVGVDVERVDPAMLIDDLIERHCTPVEIAALHRCPDHMRSARFVDLWTLKEAFVKSIGRGLAMDLKAVSFEVDDAGLIGFTPPAGIDRQRWQFGLFAPSVSARLAVAVCHGLNKAPQLIARHAAADEPAIHRLSICQPWTG